MTQKYNGGSSFQMNYDDTPIEDDDTPIRNIKKNRKYEKSKQTMAYYLDTRFKRTIFT